MIDSKSGFFFQKSIAFVCFFFPVILFGQEKNTALDLNQKCWISKVIHTEKSLFKELHLVIDPIPNQLDTINTTKSIWKFFNNQLTITKQDKKGKKSTISCQYSLDTESRILKLSFDHYSIEYNIRLFSAEKGTVILRRIDNRKQFFPKKEEIPIKIPKRKNVWVFILAGQSNMAGRAKVEPSDTIANDRILTINNSGNLILAKEPIHFYEPKYSGLDCGLSFANELIPFVPKHISILLIPTAMGGTSIHQWVNDSICNGVALMTNFQEKVKVGKKYGTIKSILWHHGENDANKKENISAYDNELKNLITQFRKITNNSKTPILLGEIGSFSEKDNQWQCLNEKIHNYIKTDSNAYLVKTEDLNDIGDRIHFNSESIRELGKRYANTYMKIKKRP
jgi:hypothetical protein